MIDVATFLFGGLVGLLIFIFVATFAQRLKQSVWHDYCTLFQPQQKETPMPHSLWQNKKCGGFLYYIFAFAGLFVLCRKLNADPYIALWWAIWLSFVILISIIDWLYRLISPLLCIWLFLWTLLGVHWQIVSVSLAQGLTSAVIILLIFYGICSISQIMLHKTMLGEGDAWLAFALGAGIALPQLPHFVFLASFYGLLFCSIQKLRKRDYQQIPFAPFLNLSAFSLLLLQ
ncbi:MULTISPECIES: prepilin peptidase [unclassified Avibacterium]|uniref:prepilin peptidase n=1 Tax=unclassified Avibacterium TaxID=2685287 RepID=UPI002026A03F|nr:MULTISPECIES: A24 family peptidase [unclassified Avibacterium]MCW9698562.1 A24 family peptidase [Avibacterium sp. 20-129]URL07205.1 A24 family peptidase [Avibacterium sp. 21-595]